MGAFTQGAAGTVQLVSGLLKKKPKRPMMDVPNSVQEATGEARQAANQSVRPGNDIAVSDIRQSTANTVGAVKGASNSVSDVLAGVGRANIAEQGALRQNNLLNAEYTNRARQQLIGQLNQQGSWEHEKFVQNKLGKYLEDRRERAELINSGLKNISEGEEQFVDFFGSFWGGGGGMMGG